jgi:Cys-tRNA(Pro) deacylase
MSKKGVTQAIRFLKRAKAGFKEHHYQYHDRGGAAQAAEELNVPIHEMIKTIVMEDESGNAMFVLMHGDREISAKSLARKLGVKKIGPVAPDRVTKLTGYKVGGTSPFGSRTSMPVMVEASILDLKTIFINGGARGLILEIDSSLLESLLQITRVDVAIDDVN